MYRLFAYAAFTIALLATSVYGDTTHTVRKGETLSGIATAYKVTVDSIKNANNLKNANNIAIGQKLTIPAKAPKFIEYKIRKGDSLSNIAKSYGISLKELSSYNNIRNANRISVGQVIKIPIRDGSSSVNIPKRSALPNSTKKELRRIKTNARKWKHIVIHHSASKSGSAKAFDRFHREERNMANGLAYHFVIGNGNGMEDGEIQIGDRWKRQIQGGHMVSQAQNMISIGICLVGDFEKTKPTRKQMQQLEALVEYLMADASVPVSRVTTHTLMHPKHTACPGKNFNLESFKRKLSK